MKRSSPLSSNDIDMLYMYFDKDRTGYINPKLVTSKLDTLVEESKVSHRFGQSISGHPRKIVAYAENRSNAIYAKPSFSPRKIPSTFHDKNLNW